MQHLDEADLILLAVDELPDGDAVSAHLAQCAHCAEALSGWRAVIGTVRTAEQEIGPEPAGPHVWAAIADQIAREVDFRPEVTASAADLRPEVTAPARVPSAASPVPLRAPERRRWMMPLIAATVGALIGGGVIYATTRPATQSPQPAVAVRAVALLGPVKTVGAAGSLGQADLLATGDQIELRVAAVGLPAIKGAYEVWLFGGDGRMVSLGVLHQGQGTFTVPDGIDPAQYRTVDISDEPSDGNPAHSTISVARGALS